MEGIMKFDHVDWKFSLAEFSGQALLSQIKQLSRVQIID